MTTNGHGRIDARARRTRRSLATALVALAPERGLDAVRVEDLVRKAGVARSTFYSHFASKADFLTASFVGMIAACDAAAREAGRADVLPTLELFTHVHRAGGFATAFGRSREFPRMLAAGEAKLRTIAEDNLARLHPALSAQERRAAAVFLAGGLVGTLRWWMESGLRQEPEALHAVFAELTRRTVTP